MLCTLTYVDLPLMNLLLITEGSVSETNKFRIINETMPYQFIVCFRVPLIHHFRVNKTKQNMKHLRSNYWSQIKLLKSHGSLTSLEVECQYRAKCVGIIVMNWFLWTNTHHFVKILISTCSLFCILGLIFNSVDNRQNKMEVP